MRWFIAVCRRSPAVITEPADDPVCRPDRDTRMLIMCAHRIVGRGKSKYISSKYQAFDIPQHEFPFNTNSKQRQIVDRVHGQTTALAEECAGKLGGVCIYRYAVTIGSYRSLLRVYFIAGVSRYGRN